MDITLVEALLVIGTFGICTGVWVTLKVIINQGNEKNCNCVGIEAMAITEKKEESN